MFEVCHKNALPLFLGLGKTPACKIACVVPVINHLEQRLKKSGFLIDEASANGLFNLISTKDKSDIPILCIDEAFNFFLKLPNSGQSQSSSH